jgi:hypothetical protein
MNRALGAHLKKIEKGLPVWNEPSEACGNKLRGHMCRYAFNAQSVQENTASLYPQDSDLLYLALLVKQTFNALSSLW